MKACISFHCDKIRIIFFKIVYPSHQYFKDDLCFPGNLSVGRSDIKQSIAVIKRYAA